MSAGAILLLLIIVLIFCRPIRKALSLLIVVLGVVACLSGIGIIIGIPMVLIGGIFLYL